MSGYDPFPIELPAPRRGRPHSSSREAISERAIELFRAHGFAGTTIDMIAVASGVSKTSFFRYYSSKSEIVWSAFDEHTVRLARVLERADVATPTMTAVRESIVDTLGEDADPDGLWLRRFELIDTSPELRAEESAHWIVWSNVVAGFVAGRIGAEPGDLMPSAIGGAVQAAFLSRLRSWLPATGRTAGLVTDLDRELAPLCRVLQEWIEA
ncbi:MAG: TetR family transcriptional regulator [Burkholderiaceae bacterium]|nr:TetR family transcriptional regulator [Microbacteriaceae bacterium]